MTTFPCDVRRQLAALRAEWRAWARGGPHLDFGLVCPQRCSECEACAAAAYRADRLAEIKTRLAVLKGAGW